MGLPGQRRSRTSKRTRAAHFALKKVTLAKCEKCGKPTLPYRACEFCGTYKGRQVLTIKTKQKTVKQKAQERKEEAKAKKTAKETKKK